MQRNRHLHPNYDQRFRFILRFPTLSSTIPIVGQSNHDSFPPSYAHTKRLNPAGLVETSRHRSSLRNGLANFWYIWNGRRNHVLYLIKDSDKFHFFFCRIIPVWIIFSHKLNERKGCRREPISEVTRKISTMTFFFANKKTHPIDRVIWEMNSITNGKLIFLGYTLFEKKLSISLVHRNIFS